MSRIVASGMSDSSLRPEGAPLDVAAVHAEQAEHVWRSLHRLGVPSADLPDLSQEVFIVVQRQRDSFDPTQSLRGWLWGICVGLVRNHRKRAFRHRERQVEAPETEQAPDAEERLDRRRRAERGQRALFELEPQRRAVFVMFEVEGMSGREIADALEIPLGTVHSRLYAARALIARALEQEQDAP